MRYYCVGKNKFITKDKYTMCRFCYNEKDEMDCATVRGFDINIHDFEDRMNILINKIRVKKLKRILK